MSHVLKNLSAETLSSITDARGYTCEKKKPTKENYIALLLDDITEEGVRQFVKSLKMNDLKEWTKKIKKDVLTSQNQNSLSSCAVLKKRLTEQMINSGLEEFLDHLSPSVSMLKIALKRMGVEGATGGKQDLKSQLVQEVTMYGLEAFFNEFSVSKLHEMADDLKLSISSNSKPVLVRCVVNMVDYVPPANKTRKRKEQFELEFSSDDGVDYVDDDQIEDVPIPSEEDEDMDEKKSPAKPPKKRSTKNTKENLPKNNDKNKDKKVQKEDNKTNKKKEVKKEDKMSDSE